MAQTRGADEPRPVELVRGLGLLDATLLIVGSVIGSGIFFAPSIMAGYLQSPGLLLGLWVLGGLLTLAGAMSKALFSYDSWYTVTLATEEVKVVPIGEMAAVTENRVATEAAVRMIGPAGGAFIAAATLVSTFGCVNGLTLGPPQHRPGLLLTAAGVPAYPYWRRHR